MDARSGTALAYRPWRPMMITMSKRRRRLVGELGRFIRQYGRKAQRGREPNDRRYDRGIERLAKRMDPAELDELLREDVDPDDPAAGIPEPLARVSPGATSERRLCTFLRTHPDKVRTIALGSSRSCASARTVLWGTAASGPRKLAG
jgi:hypothetical protein